MNTHRTHRAIASGLLALLALSCSTCWADPPSIFGMFRKKQPITNDALELKAEHGPWMILATTFAGEDAHDDATALANEIRTSMQLPCYIMEKTIGSNQPLVTREIEKTDEFGNQKRYQLEMKYANGSPTRAFAVLVGEFTSTEDPRIAGTLESLRVAQPVCMQDEGKDDASKVDDSNWLVQKYRSAFWSRTDRNHENGPLGAAFVTRNPMLPDDFFQAPRVDSFVESLNREKFINYSLLDCPGSFTVRVASFRGQEATDFGNGTQVSKLSEKPDSLDKAGMQAHTMTESLRKRGVEAYEFHDRFGSYVMIGSFDRLGQQMESGQFEYNPAMLAILKEYCGYRVIDTKDPRTGAVAQRTSLKSEAKIPFDIEGKPMVVPRPETSKLYSNSLLGSR